MKINKFCPYFRFTLYNTSMKNLLFILTILTVLSNSLANDSLQGDLKFDSIAVNFTSYRTASYCIQARDTSVSVRCSTFTDSGSVQNVFLSNDQKIKVLIDGKVISYSALSGVWNISTDEYGIKTFSNTIKDEQNNLAVAIKDDTSLKIVYMYSDKIFFILFSNVFYSDDVKT